MPEYLTTEEVAELCRTSPATVRYWRHIKKLHGFKVGRRVLYAREDVQRYLSEARAEQAVA